jgi:hypothetical protein
LASSTAARASAMAASALCAFCRTVLVISSMLAAVSSSVEACSSVRLEGRRFPRLSRSTPRGWCRLHPGCARRSREAVLHGPEGLEQARHLVLAVGLDRVVELSRGDAPGEVDGARLAGA